MAAGPAGCVIQLQRRLFIHPPQENNCTKPTEFLEKVRLVKSVGSLSLVGDAEEAAQHLWGCHGCGIVGHNTFHVGVPKRSVFCTVSPQ